MDVKKFLAIAGKLKSFVFTEEKRTSQFLQPTFLWQIRLNVQIAKATKN